MLGLFIILGITILILIVILLWFVPHLLQQQEQQASREIARLRQLLLELMHEQEAVTTRQGQLGTSVCYLQEQLDHVEQTVHTQVNNTHQRHTHMPSSCTTQLPQLHELDARMRAVQQEIETYQHHVRSHAQRDNESWAYLLSLLSAILDKVRHIPSDQPVSRSEKRYTSHEHYRY